MPTRNLDRTGTVEFAFSSQIGFMCKLRRWVDTQIVLFSTSLDLRLPTGVSTAHTKKSRKITGRSMTMILGILCSRYLSEIRQSIVFPVSVYMVYMQTCPHSACVKNSKLVGQIESSAYLDLDIPVGVNRSSHIAYTDALVALKPGKHPSVRVVVKKFAQTLCGKIGLSHDVLQLLIGQRPVCVDSTDGLRHFITRPCSWVADITKCLQQSARRVVSACMPAHSRFFAPYGALTPFNAL